MNKPPHQADGFHTVTPSLTIKGASAALDFYPKAFGAQERFRLEGPDGTLMHAELQFGDSVVMISDEFPDWGAHSPATLGGNGGSLMLYVPNVDTAFEQAVAAGATALQPPTDQFWGDRTARVRDPFGHTWGLATHIEEVAPEEMNRRATEWIKSMTTGAA